MLILTGVALIATGLFLAYQSGNATIRDAESHIRYADRLVDDTPSRRRHPSAR